VFAIDFSRRSDEKEKMDLGQMSAREARDTYRLIHLVNRFLGGTRVILHHLRHFSRRWRPGQRVRILDVGAGNADIPRAVIDWARKKPYDVFLTALDNSLPAVRLMQKECAEYPEIFPLQGSVHNLPFSQKSFDYVISSMFFHHLNDSEIASTLQSFEGIASRGIIINDLLRHPLAYAGIYLLSRLTSDSFFRYDAPLSVLRGFSVAEAGALISKSGIPYLRFYRHTTFRLALAGESER